MNRTEFISAASNKFVKKRYPETHFEEKLIDGYVVHSNPEKVMRN
jgi:hypothetical protein